MTTYTPEQIYFGQLGRILDEARKAAESLDAPPSRLISFEGLKRFDSGLPGAPIAAIDHTLDTQRMRHIFLQGLETLRWSCEPTPVSVMNALFSAAAPPPPTPPPPERLIKQLRDKNQYLTICSMLSRGQHTWVSLPSMCDQYPSAVGLVDLDTAADPCRLYLDKLCTKVGHLPLTQLTDCLRAMRRDDVADFINAHY